MSAAVRLKLSIMSSVILSPCWIVEWLFRNPQLLVYDNDMNAYSCCYTRTEN